MQKIKFKALLHCSVAGAALVSLAAALPAAEPIDVGDRVCLFLDDYFVARQSKLQRQWHSGVPHPTAIINPDKPWEGWVFMYGSVFHEPEKNRFRMWYQAWNGSLNYKVCYAESTDGLVWEKPELGLWEFEGSKRNNILIPGCAMPNVFIDQSPKIGDQMKMFVWAASHPDKTIHRHCLFSSKDGLRWKYLGQRRFGPDGDSGRWIKDANVIRWDERTERWAASHRSWTKFPIGEKNDIWRRTLSSTSSNRLLEGWTPLKLILKPDEIDDKATERLSQNSTKPDWSELYGMPVFRYGNHDLGMLSVLDLIDGSDRVLGGGRVELAFSHDGQKWHRTSPRVRFIASDPDRGDLFAIYTMTTAPILHNDRLWVYYTEANSMHPIRPSDRWITRIRLATWRKDGFASLRAAETGELVTKPLRFKGRHLFINSRSESAGNIRAALLDAEGEEIRGFGIADCKPIKGDALSATVSWSDNVNLRSLQGKAVRLRIVVEESTLWSFRFGDS